MKTSFSSDFPVRVLQFGSGNFLRGFADWMIQKTNEQGMFNGRVCVVQSVSNSNALEKQAGVYHVRQSGLQNDEYKTVVDRVEVIARTVKVNEAFDKFLEEALNPHLEFIISNTTETGIEFKKEKFDFIPTTYPGKLTRLLYHRFQNALNQQVIILPCELVERNGEKLKKCVEQYAREWSLSPAFMDWVESTLVFCSTLVDRIVTGAPQTYNDIHDELFLETELFHLWAIECPPEIKSKIPFAKAGLNVILTRDIETYRTRKVRILNGAHTTLACAGYLAGLNTVREVMEHAVLGRFVRKLVYDEILPTLHDNKEELEIFTEEVFNRFRNPAIKHELINITLSSFAKFGIRLVPSIRAFYEQQGFLPARIIFSLAATIFFYRGLKGGKIIPLKDNPNVIETLKGLWGSATFTDSGMQKLAFEVMNALPELKTLLAIPDLYQRTGKYLYQIDQEGILDAIKKMQEPEYLL